MDRKLQLVKVINPFDRHSRDISYIDFNGKSLLDLKNEYISSDIEFVASVNGRIIPIEKLSLIIPKENDCIVFTPEIKGGGGGGGEGTGKSILRMVAFIGLTLLTAGYGASLAGAMGITSNFGIAMVQMGMMVVGGLLINALLPMPMPKEPDSLESGQTYSWNPKTTQEQGLVIPKAYGRNKLYGNVIGTYIYHNGSDSYINVLVHLGIGPISDIHSIKLNDQPSAQLSGINIETRLGYLTQDVITGLGEASRIEYPISLICEGGAAQCHTSDPEWVYYTTEGDSFDCLYVVLCFPQGLYGIEKDDGDVKPVSVVFSLNYRKVGGSWVNLIDSKTITQRTQKPIFHTEVIDGLEYGYKYQIAVIKNSCEFEEEPSKYSIKDYGWSAYVFTMQLSSVQEVLWEAFSYPRQVLVGIKALATDQLSGSLQFSCMSNGAIVRTYNGSTWSSVYSNNPAWVVWDILTQPVLDNDLNVVRYDGYDPSYLDLPKFYEWAQWCDGNVSDGQGGMEKRCVFNGVLDSETSVWEAVMIVAQVGRAAVLPIGFKITVVIDKPSTPVQLFTVGNMIEDSFSETFLSLDERASELEISFVNREKDYEPDTFTVINDNLDTPAYRVNMQLKGITRASEAWRAGMYRLYCNQYITKTVQFDADIDSLACTIGDVINVQHDVPQWGYGGRLENASIDSITLDRTVTLDIGKAYGVIIRLALDDSLVERTVTNVHGDTSVLTLSVPFDVIPSKYDVYSFGELVKVTKPFRVINISRTGDLQCKITGVEYNESIYNVDTEEPVIPTINYSDLELFPPVTGLTAKELLLREGNTIVTAIDIAFNPPFSSIYNKAEIWYKPHEAASWIFVGVSRDYIRIKSSIEDGETYDIAVLTINTAGQRMGFSIAPTVSIEVRGKLTLPEDITELWGEASIGGIRLQWSSVGDIDLDHYELRFHQDIVGKWEDSMFICDTYSTSKTLPAARTGKYLVKAVDTGKRKSLNAAEFYTFIPDIIGWNVKETLTENPSWTGDKVNLMVAEGNLLIEDTGSAFWDNVEDFDAIQNIDTLDGGGGVETTGSYTTANLDLGTVQDVRCKGRVLYYGIDPSSAFDNILNFDEIPAFDSVGISTEVTAKLYMRASQDMVTWNDWQPLFVADTQGRGFNFKMETDIIDITKSIEVHELEFEVDMPDRWEEAQDVICPAIGLDIVFAKPFLAKPRIGVTIQTMQDGDYYAISSASVIGFTIMIKNGVSGVERTIDWYAKGY